MTKKTPKGVWDQFLRILKETGNVTISSKAVGVVTRTANLHREQDPEFSREWDAAMQEAGDKLEHEATRRAVAGVERAMMYQGRQIGVVREYSDRMLEFLLTGIRPEKYAHRWKGEVTGKGGTPLVPENSINDAARRIAFLLTQATEKGIVPEPEKDKKDSLH